MTAGLPDPDDVGVCWNNSQNPSGTSRSTIPTMAAGRQCVRDWSGGGVQGVPPFVDGGDAAAPREDFVDESVVHGGVGVGASVGQDGDLVVEVNGLQCGGQDDPADGDAGQGKMVDLLSGQDLLEVVCRRRR